MSRQHQHTGRFRALVVRKDENGTVTRTVEQRAVDNLPPGDVLVQVAYSSLNYKDALSATGHPGVTRDFPHTPGIDVAGSVVESAVDAFQPGDKVLVSGYDLGQDTDGGFGRYVSVPAEWIIRLPEGLSLFESMIYGTAGFTAAMSLQRLFKAGLTPDQGEVVVTGASGGVGCMAVGLLAKSGFTTVAATGKPQAHAMLQELGAEKVLDRQELDDQSQRPLLKGRWAGAIDTVGGNILATVLKAIQPEGIVTCCGNVASATLSTTVYPFILRGVSLLGIEAANCSLDLRRDLWGKLAGEWKLPGLERFATTCSLDTLSGEIDKILAGQQMGRIVVDLQAE